MQHHSSRASGCRIFVYTHRGSTFIQMENSALRLTIWPDKGADITEILYKPMDIDFMWKAPAGIVDPALQVQTTANSALGNNLDYYEGGWHESLPGGGPYADFGMEQGLHGEVALLPWSWTIVSDHEDEICVELACRTIRAPLSVRKRVTLRTGRPVIEFQESVTNESGQPFPFLWGQHPTFGAPFLGPDCHLDTPAERFTVSPAFETPTGLFAKGHSSSWPIATRPDGTTVDMGAFPAAGVRTADLYFLEGFTEGWYGLTSRRLGLGIGMAWDARIFNCIWYWKVLNGLDGYPWFGRTYNIGVEFWNGWPDYRTLREAGRLPALAAGETISTRYCTTVYRGAGKVTHISPDGLASMEE